MLIEVDLFQQCLHALFALLGRYARESAEVVERLVCSHIRVHGEILRQVAYHGAYLCRLPDGHAAYSDLAALHRVERGYGLHQGRFARTVASEQTEHTLFDSEVDIEESLLSPVELVHFSDNYLVVHKDTPFLLYSHHNRRISTFYLILKSFFAASVKM